MTQASAPMATRPLRVVLMGVSGCGKSTVSNLVDHKLHALGVRFVAGQRRTQILNPLRRVTQRKLFRLALPLREIRLQLLPATPSRRAAATRKRQPAMRADVHFRRVVALRGTVIARSVVRHAMPRMVRQHPDVSAQRPDRTAHNQTRQSRFRVAPLPLIRLVLPRAVGPVALVHGPIFDRFHHRSPLASLSISFNTST